MIFFTLFTERDWKKVRFSPVFTEMSFVYTEVAKLYRPTVSVYKEAAHVMFFARTEAKVCNDNRPNTVI